MSIHRCPGQHARNWRPEDVFEVACPECGKSIEFFKDDQARRCAHCGWECRNPKLNVGCLEWCQYADKCRPMFEQAKREKS